MLIGIYLRHIKAYKGINFIPIKYKYKFSSYIGENGSGKSSILEALDAFFNSRPYIINKSALADGISSSTNEPFITLIFLIPKNKVTKQKKEFEKISNFFWTIEKNKIASAVQGSMREFFEMRKLLINDGYEKKDYYLIIIGENNLQATRKLYFGSFHSEENFLNYFLNTFYENKKDGILIDKKQFMSKLRSELQNELEKNDWRKFYLEIKKVYSYVYMPVELDVEDFTKIETSEMQKIFDKTLKTEINKALSNINLNNVDGINEKLKKFINEIEKSLNNEYCYDTGKLRNNNVTKSDIVNKIIEVYFQKRVLYKKDSKKDTKVSELSAGEKRQALINLLYAFLKKNCDRESMIIIGIDEPESSLHTTLCYEQFEKLSIISKSNQILITTHWYYKAAN